MNKISPSQIKRIKKKSSKSNVKDAEYIMIEGEKIVLEALSNPKVSIYQVYATSEWLDKSNCQKKYNIPMGSISIISSSQLRQLSNLKNPNQVIALIDKQFEVHKPNIDQWKVVLDNIQNPGNLGTIIRTCDWFGIHHIICSQQCVYKFNSKVIQSCMGSIFRVQVDYVDLHQWLPHQSIPKFVATLISSNQSSVMHKLPQEGILVLGNESKGVSTSVIQKCDHMIHIPSCHSEADSLNVGVACGILLSKIYT